MPGGLALHVSPRPAEAAEGPSSHLHACPRKGVPIPTVWPLPRAVATTVGGCLGQPCFPLQGSSPGTACCPVLSLSFSPQARSSVGAGRWWPVPPRACSCLGSPPEAQGLSPRLHSQVRCGCKDARLSLLRPPPCKHLLRQGGVQTDIFHRKPRDRHRWSRQHGRWMDRGPGLLDRAGARTLKETLGRCEGSGGAPMCLLPPSRPAEPPGRQRCPREAARSGAVTASGSPGSRESSTAQAAAGTRAPCPGWIPPKAKAKAIRLQPRN